MAKKQQKPLEFLSIMPGRKVVLMYSLSLQCTHTGFLYKNRHIHACMYIKIYIQICEAIYLYICVCGFRALLYTIPVERKIIFEGHTF